MCNLLFQLIILTTILIIHKNNFPLDRLFLNFYIDSKSFYLLLFYFITVKKKK